MTDEPLVRVYSFGLCYLSACCAPADREVLEQAVNLEMPTGIDSPWHVSPERFKTGEPNPTPCPDSPGRLHYLFRC